MNTLSILASVLGVAFAASVAAASYFSARRLERSIRARSKHLDDLYAPKDEAATAKRSMIVR